MANMPSLKLIDYRGLNAAATAAAADIQHPLMIAVIYILEGESSDSGSSFALDPCTTEVLQQATSFALSLLPDLRQALLGYCWPR